MRFYCTYFDINFLSRGLVLLESLKQHECDFILYALCLDDETYAVVRRLRDPQFIPITLSEIETADPRLPVARANRSRIEYYFTLSPFLPLHLLRDHPDIPLITYVDADCCFYSSPQPVFDELADKSVLIVEHRYPSHEQYKSQYGRYNVGLLTFRNDQDGHSCLERWAGQCAAWCYDRLEEGKFADQKYLDEWPNVCRCVHVLQHKGVNLAPWNAANFKLSRRAGTLWVDEYPLIMYHFHGLRFVAPGKFCPTLDAAGLGPEHIQFLYMPYAQALVKSADRYDVPSGEYRRKPASGPSGDGDSMCVTIHTWPAPFWFAGLRWRVLQSRRSRQAVSQAKRRARQAALGDIIETFHARDWGACGKRLHEGVRQHPSLLLNNHVWNVFLRYVFLRPNK
jgi:hypothetical protein